MCRLRNDDHLCLGINVLTRMLWKETNCKSRHNDHYGVRRPQNSVNEQALPMHPPRKSMCWEPFNVRSMNCYFGIIHRKAHQNLRSSMMFSGPQGHSIVWCVECKWIIIIVVIIVVGVIINNNIIVKPMLSSLLSLLVSLYLLVGLHQLT